MKINLGCGRSHLPGFINVDIWEPNKPDIVADIRQPIAGLEDGCAEFVLCSHVLEHLTETEDWKLVVLEMQRLLKSGGEWEVRVPHPAHDDAMIYGHVHVFTPRFFRDAQAFNWLGDAVLIDLIEEIPDPDCVVFCKRNDLQFLTWAPFLRNAYRETVMRGHKR